MAGSGSAGIPGEVDDKQLLDEQMAAIMKRMELPYTYGYGEQDRADLEKILSSGNLGAQDAGMVGHFERQFAEIYGAPHGIAANAAMSLLHAAVYDEALGDRTWLLKREVVPGSEPVGYFYSRRFAGDEQGLSYDEFKRIAAETGPNMEFGFTQIPPYRYRVFLRPLAYGNKGCPLHCPYYKGEYVYKDGLCPNAEAILPRLVYTAITVGREASPPNAELWRTVGLLAVSCGEFMPMALIRAVPDEAVFADVMGSIR